jgi:hypothetical protein
VCFVLGACKKMRAESEGYRVDGQNETVGGVGYGKSKKIQCPKSTTNFGVLNAEGTRGNGRARGKKERKMCFMIWKNE